MPPTGSPAEPADRPLRRRDLHPDPIRQFEAWLEAARRTEEEHATAMTLATAAPDGSPSARTVLLKGFDERGFLFFTNYESDKARDLEANPRAALLFHWRRVERQVRIAGPVARAGDEEEADRYFASRARASQLAACISRQSRPVASRRELEEELARLASRYPDEVPRPAFWGGYRVRAERIEFWQGRPGRLHDRFVYVARGASYRVSRLAP